MADPEKQSLINNEETNNTYSTGQPSAVVGSVEGGEAGAAIIAGANSTEGNMFKSNIIMNLICNQVH